MPKDQKATGSTGSSMVPPKEKVGGGTITNRGYQGGETGGELVGAKKENGPKAGY